MNYKQEKELLVREFDQWYRTRPISVASLAKQFDAMAAERTHLSAFERKSCVYKLAARELDIKIFRHFPFFFELNAGQTRCCRPGEGLSGWLRADMAADEQYASAVKRLGEHELARLPGAPRTLSLELGLSTIIDCGTAPLRERMKASLDKAQARRRKDFCNAAITALDSIEELANRFAERAKAMHNVEIDAGIKRGLQDMAGFTMTGPADGFFMALQRAIFWRETMQALEGADFSSFGRLDEILSKYYAADVASGAITREHAAELLRFFFEYDSLRSHGETRIQLTLGESPSELTYLMLELLAERECKGIDLAAYISGDDPEEYVSALQPLLKYGVRLLNRERLKGGYEFAKSGLQLSNMQTVLERASVSLPAIFLGTLQPALVDNWAGFDIDCYEGDFFAADDIYTQFLDNLAAIERYVVKLLAKQADARLQRCPMPLHSLSIHDCADRARDITECGARKTTILIELEGIGTVVRSMNAVRRLVYAEHRLPLSRFIEALKNDYANDEPLRALACQANQKDDDELFAMLVNQINEMFGTLPTSSGMEIQLALCALPESGLRCPATPDGRRANALFASDYIPEPECDDSDASSDDIAGIPLDVPEGITEPSGPKREDILSAYLDTPVADAAPVELPASFDEVPIEDELPVPDSTARNDTPLFTVSGPPRIVLGDLLGSACTLKQIPGDAEQLRSLAERLSRSACAVLEFRAD